MLVWIRRYHRVWAVTIEAAPDWRKDFVGAEFVAYRKEHVKDLPSLLDQEAGRASCTARQGRRFYLLGHSSRQICRDLKLSNPQFLEIKRRVREKYDTARKAR
jgi:DNA-binding CsgD family transcriptional regulator